MWGRYNLNIWIIKWSLPHWIFFKCISLSCYSSDSSYTVPKTFLKNALNHGNLSEVTFPSFKTESITTTFTSKLHLMSSIKPLAPHVFYLSMLPTCNHWNTFVAICTPFLGARSGCQSVMKAWIVVPSFVGFQATHVPKDPWDWYVYLHENHPNQL